MCQNFGDALQILPRFEVVNSVVDAYVIHG
jgi:hypothetical protein